MKTERNDYSVKNDWKSKIARNSAIVVSTALMAPFAFAGGISKGQTIGEIADNFTTSLKGVDGTVTALAWVMAFVIALVAIFKFKAHSENPRETPLKTPLLLLFVAVLCVSLPMVLSSGTKTLYKQTDISAPTWAKTQGGSGGGGTP